MAKNKETKEILSNVVFHDQTYGPGDEDALEERLTPERCEQLQKSDPPALAGNWKPTGTPEEPMAGIPAEKAERAEKAAKKAQARTVAQAAVHPSPGQPPKGR